ncbi:MAG: hypothetical protein ACLPX5_02910 [Dissulfurispiraceae bacterium]
MAKDTWKDVLLSTPKGLDLMKIMEEAEDEFVDFTLMDPMEKLDSALSVINTRAAAFLILIDYLSQHRQA